MLCRPIRIACLAAAVLAAALAWSDPTGALSDAELKPIMTPWAESLGGASFALRVDDRTAVYAGGVPTTGFPIGSLAKQFTAVLILDLVAEGKLSLDATLDDLGVKVPNAENITIRNLLTHTSGLPDYLGGQDLATATTDHQVRQRILDLAAQASKEPGAFEYSNTNYMLLGQIAAAVANKPLSQLYRDEVMQKAGLRIQLKSSPNLDVSWAGAAGGLVGDIRDLAAWEQMIGGRNEDLLSSDDWDQMLDNGVAMSASGPDYLQAALGMGNAKYGFGLQIGTYGLYPSIYHTGIVPPSGSNAGYTCFAGVTNDIDNPRSFVMFSRAPLDLKATNALMGAYNSALALSDAKLWAERLVEGLDEDEIGEYVRQQVLDPDLGALIQSQGTANLGDAIGNVTSLMVSKAVVTPAEATFTGALVGNQGRVNVTIKIGKNGSLLAFSYR